LYFELKLDAAEVVDAGLPALLKAVGMLRLAEAMASRDYNGRLKAVVAQLALLNSSLDVLLANPEGEQEESAHSSRSQDSINNTQIESHVRMNSKVGH